jgi:hypothetical protein
MAEFRKSKSGRMFFRVVDDQSRMTVTKIITKANESSISVYQRSSGLLVAGGIVVDDEMYSDINEEEFREAFKEALRVISEQKI